ncbi:MAG: hypothetical protein ACT4OK_16085 [Gemmobacter sp.]
MKPVDLLDQALHLTRRARGKPKRADLCRAQSAAYYALFHRLCILCAGSLLGLTPAARQQPKWVALYRSLRHENARKCCQNSDAIRAINVELAGSARAFLELQDKRHRADYDPSYRPRKSIVLNDIEQATSAISQIDSLPEAKRREFALLLLYKLE